MVAGAPELVRLLRLEDAIPSLRMSHVRAPGGTRADESDVEERSGLDLLVSWGSSLFFQRLST